MTFLDLKVWKCHFFVIPLQPKWRALGTGENALWNSPRQCFFWISYNKHIYNYLQPMARHLKSIVNNRLKGIISYYVPDTDISATYTIRGRHLRSHRPSSFALCPHCPPLCKRASSRPSWTGHLCLIVRLDWLVWFDYFIRLMRYKLLNFNY